MLRRSARAHQGVRALAAASGLALIATSVSLVAAPAQAADPVDIQIIGTNDFHGRLIVNRTVGAAKYAGAVNALRAENPNTIFAAAGDLIGATTFESFIAHDKPTIDVFNEMDLDVSAVGNHEFDQGYDDLVNRVMAPYDAATNPEGGAEWEYIAANIEEPGDADNIAPSWTREVGGVTVGFVGAITEDLETLVRPSGIVGVEITDVVAATNEEAAELRADGADVVVLLVHEGAPSTDCATMDDDPTSTFGSIVTGVSGDVDAIVSGHTHLNYDCSFPVAAWAGRPVTERPVVSAGQYGDFLNRLTFSVDPDSGSVLASDNQNINLNTSTYAADPAVQAIVDDAVEAAKAPGAAELGQVAAPIRRAYRPKTDGTGLEENRGGESTLGNLIAEAQRWAADADLGLMNPGGMREDMVGMAEGGYPAPVTYRQAADAQPFANTLVNVELTGAQLKAVLEQQWQPEGSTRPFLRLGTSHGFQYTYDPASRQVTAMFLNGERMRDGETYTVVANSFLAGGGDNFTSLRAGKARDTGKTDLEAMVDYLGEFASKAPLAPEFDQHAVGVTFPAGAPSSYGAGDRLAFELSSLTMVAADSTLDDEVVVSIGDKDLGTFPVDNEAAPGSTDDEAGTATVSVKLPAGLPGGNQIVTVTGAETGTQVWIPVRLEKSAATISAKVTPRKIVVNKTTPTVQVKVRSGGQAAGGKVEVRVGGKTYTARLKNGKAKVKLPAFQAAGEKQVRIRYLGNAAIKSASASVTITVKKK